MNLYGIYIHVVYIINVGYEQTHSLYIIDIQKECFAFIQFQFHWLSRSWIDEINVS